MVRAVHPHAALIGFVRVAVRLRHQVDCGAALRCPDTSVGMAEVEAGVLGEAFWEATLPQSIPTLCRDAAGEQPVLLCVPRCANRGRRPGLPLQGHHRAGAGGAPGRCPPCFPQGLAETAGPEPHPLQPDCQLRLYAVGNQYPDRQSRHLCRDADGLFRAVVAAMPDGGGTLRQHHGAKAAGAKPEGALHPGRDFHNGAGGLSGVFGRTEKVDGGEGEGVVWGALGEITIPEIQRPFVWDSSKVRDGIPLYRSNQLSEREQKLSILAVK